MPQQSPVGMLGFGTQSLLWKNAGPPATNAYAGLAREGALLIDYSTPGLYQNTGSLASPVWTSVGSGGGSIVPPVVVPAGETTTIAANGSGILISSGSGASTVYLPALSAMTLGGTITVADDGTATAGPITIHTTDGSTIGGIAGATGFVINQNYGSTTWRAMSLTRWSRV